MNVIALFYQDVQDYLTEDINTYKFVEIMDENGERWLALEFEFLDDEVDREFKEKYNVDEYVIVLKEFPKCDDPLTLEDIKDSIMWEY